MSSHRVSLALFAAILAMLAAAWVFWPRPQPVAGQSVPLPPAPEVRTVEKVVERVKYVKVYPDAAKADVDLPEPVAANPAKKLTATGKLHAEDRPYTLTAVLDTTTGESEVYARPDPLPWLAPDTRTEVGVFYGYKDGEQAIRIDGRQTLVRVKALRLGAVASADATPGNIDTFIGVGAWMRW